MNDKLSISEIIRYCPYCKGDLEETSDEYDLGKTYQCKECKELIYWNDE